jgi:hypothetical protein
MITCHPDKKSGTATMPLSLQETDIIFRRS